MIVTPSHVDCWILDDVDDHFSAVWELVSVLQQRQPTLEGADIQQQLKERLRYLLEHEYLSIYQGVVFNGDETVIKVTVSQEFIAVQADDWKTGSAADMQYKVHITEKGREFFLKNCDRSFFPE